MQTKIELYQLVSARAGLGIYERNLSTGAVYWNEYFREILEVDAEYQPDGEIAAVFYKNPDEVRSMIRQAVALGKPQQATLQLISAKGNLKWVKIRMHVRTDQTTNDIIYGTFEDVTEEVVLKQLLEERDRRFVQAFSHAPIGMALVSPEGRWMRINDSLCTLLGFDEQELTGRFFRDCTHPDDLDADLEKMQQLLAGEIISYSMEKRYIHKSGHFIWALLNVSIVRDEDQQPLYFISQIKDITERKKNTDTIRAQNERLLNFAHIVSHNLRSHAGNIRMLTNMISLETDAEEREILISMLDTNAENLLSTLEGLNEVVKIHDEGLSGREVVSLCSEISRVTAILSASIIKEKASVLVRTDSDVEVLFNKAYLESLFINLITNSLKYRHPDRAPEITITIEALLGSVNITYSDNGSGLDMGLHGHKLFGLYKTFHGNEDARGLGLFLVKNQIEAMGGTITAESSPGNGITFYINISKN